MWVFLSGAMLSIVEDRKDPDRLLVRARFKNDIQCVFPRAQVQRTPKADYLFRASVDRDVVAAAMSNAVRAIEYDNFKSSVPPDESERYRAYTRVWGEMVAAQAAADRLDRGSTQIS